MYRTGIGYDSHRFTSGRKLILGGIEIPFDKGLGGHSDADVLCHSIMDAILGAAGLGDIGQHFPDTNEKWKDASSVEMLTRVVTLTRGKGFEIEWIDASILAEKPLLDPYSEKMKGSISASGIPAEKIHLKATTNEKMGFIGRGEGIAVMSVCTISKKP